jgi:DNA sulfur modification protein DndB
METLNPTNGHIIAGTKIDGHRFVGRVKTAQLFQIAPDPRDTENKKKTDATKELQDLRSVRDEVQRLFEGAKRKNVPSYADYIVSLHGGNDGLAPCITLYSEEPLLVQERDDGTAFIQVTWDQKLVAIDGETQLAARHEAANLEPATKQDFVPIYICHGKNPGWARQSFHDLNALGVKPNAALSIGMDARDPITHVCREVERNVPFLKDRVNKVRRQLRSTDSDIVTITSLRGACVTLAKGINGVQFGARPVPIDASEIPAIKAASIDWFAAVTASIGPAMEDRINKLASAPAVLSAIGAMGHQLVGIGDETVRKSTAKQLAKELSSVNWERNDNWAGIAGKTNPKGVLSVGGAKENAYAVYSALTDPSSSGYAQIRNVQSMKAA